MKEIQEIFDCSFKVLMMLSNETIITAMNTLFGDAHPLNSSVSYPNTEYITPDLEKRQADMLIVIENIKYLLECQTWKDAGMVIRLFRYGLSEGERTKSIEDGVMVVDFPKTMLIDLTSIGGRDILVLELRFPDGGSYRYSCPVYKVLEHSVEELDREGLMFLLPFYLLKLRKGFEKAASEEKRHRVIGEVKKLRKELEGRVKGAEGAKRISGEDAETMGKVLAYMYEAVYNKYEGGEEGDMGEVYNAETFGMFEKLVMQRKQWELKAREHERRGEELEEKLRENEQKLGESERQRKELERQRQELERQRQELEQKLQERGML